VYIVCWIVVGSSPSCIMHIIQNKYFVSLLDLSAHQARKGDTITCIYMADQRPRRQTTIQTSNADQPQHSPPRSCPKRRPGHIDLVQVVFVI
jgi:hypothetical protein